jgi:glycosyltransferase involved in cell wall biosynthesis
LPPFDSSPRVPFSLKQLRSEFPQETDALQQAVRRRVTAGPGSPRKAMRVLHVITSLSPTDGGPPEMLKQLAANYLALGDHLEVATLDMPEAPYLADLNFIVHALGPRRGSYGLSPKLQRWLYANAPRFDLIVINNVWLFPAVAAWRAARRARAPHAVFTHGALDVFFKKRYPLKHVKKLIYWPLQYAILRSAAAVLFTSELERELALASFRPNAWTSIVLPYGTNEPEGEPAAQLEAFYAALPAMHGRRFLLFLSRIHEKKGCDLLIEAFAQLAPQYPDVDLVVAGPDQMHLQARLQQQAEKAHVGDRIHWPGMLEGAAKFGAFRAAEAFVLPSHQENFGIVVAEALACGTPVLISNQVNIWREILDSGVGLVEPDTLPGTLQLLRGWLDLPAQERARMAAATQDTFHQRFSLRRTAESLHALSEIVNRK